MTEAIEVRFNDEQRARVIAEATRRHVTSANYEPRNGAPSGGVEGYRCDLIGAAGEMAAGIVLDCTDSVFVFADKMRKKKGNPDLPGDVEVKATTRHSNRLAINLCDNKLLRYVLVTIERKKILVRGWAVGREVMREDNKDDPIGGQTAFYVGKGELHRMAELYDLVKSCAKNRE